MLSLPTQLVTELTCTGTPFEMGFAQGQALREKIQGSIEALANLEAVRLMKPRLLPFSWFWRLAAFKSERFLQQAFAASPLWIEERLRGIAEGSGVPFRTLAIGSVMEAALSDLGPITTIAATAGCSAMAVSRSASCDGRPMLAHNFDYLPITQPYYFIRRSNPTGKLSSVEFSLAPLAGAVTGINEAGLCITCNYAYATDKGRAAPTVTMLIADALARFRSVDQAVDFFFQSPRVGGGLLMLGDPSGTIASLEISNTRVERREPAAGHDRLFHTNRYCCAAMSAIEVDDRAMHGTKSPRPLRGHRVHQSADERSALFQELIDSEVQFDRVSMQKVMSSHGSSHLPSSGTICMHSDYWHTTASMQLFPSERLLRVSFSPACVAEYREFTV